LLDSLIWSAEQASFANSFLDLQAFESHQVFLNLSFQSFGFNCSPLWIESGFQFSPLWVEFLIWVCNAFGGFGFNLKFRLGEKALYKLPENKS
jgi:hypothetical protein